MGPRHLRVMMASIQAAKSLGYLASELSDRMVEHWGVSRPVADWVVENASSDSPLQNVEGENELGRLFRVLLRALVFCILAVLSDRTTDGPIRTVLTSISIICATVYGIGVVFLTIRLWRQRTHRNS